MRKFTKGMLIAAGIFGAAGIGLTTAGGVIGASMSEVLSFKNFRGAFWPQEVVEALSDDETDEIEDDDLKAAVKSENSTDCRVYDLKYQPVELDIELRYDELDLEEGDSFSVKVYNDNGNKVTVKESADTLKVRSTDRKSKARKVCISYPKDVKLKKLDLEMGAGAVYINREIQTEELNVDMGAGEFVGNVLVTAKDADLQIGTGSMTFNDLSAEKINGECGLGEMDLTVTGKEEDYNYDLQCGIGNMDIGSDSYSGLGREKHISNASADRKLELECGMGNVSVSFSGKNHRG